MAKVSFNVEFGGFSIRQSNHYRNEPTVDGAFHRLTPEQFDALVEAFEQTSETQTLTTDGKYGKVRTFRTAAINFGGLQIHLYADVPEAAKV